MKILLLSIFLIKFIIPRRCHVTENATSQTCFFSLTNGDFDKFVSNVPALKECARKFGSPSLEIKLINSSLPAFPDETFTDLPDLQNFKLDICNGSKIQLLSPQLPNSLVFRNLKFNTAVFDISDSASIIGWKWDVLSDVGHDGMKYFKFYVFRTKITRLAADFGKIANGRLTAIRIMRCQLRWLSKNVFGPHSKLIVLELKDNLIENFERFHLPDNPSMLKVLDLGDNRLQYISQDVFTNLKLDTLYLNGNNLKILSNQMKSINEAEIPSIYGALWPCDCNTILRLSERLQEYFLKEQCYTNESIMNIEEFKNSCELQIVV